MIVAELKRREAMQTKVEIDWKSLCHPGQWEFITNPNRLKAVCTTRRYGKSTMDAIYLLKESDQQDDVVCLYLHKTRALAETKFFLPILVPMFKKLYKGRYKKDAINKTKLSVTLPNGSIIYCYGADASDDDVEKLLGGKHPLVLLDEAQSWTVDQRDLVYAKLKPAVLDYMGTIAMTGTPGNYKNTMYYDVVTQNTDSKTWQAFDSQWYIHNGNTRENPFMKANFEAEIANFRATTPNIDEVPWFQQMYEGKWVTDKDKRVYRFDMERNIVKELPEQFDYIIIGVDLGWTDQTAWTIVGWNDDDKNLYIIESLGFSKLTFDRVVEITQAYMQKYPNYSKIIIDGANQQGIQTMKERSGIPFTDAKKRGKMEFISIMNADFITGKIKIYQKDCEQLIDEYEGLIWNDKEGALKKEHSACNNHCADASLYAWREAYNWTWQPTIPKVVLTEQQKIDKWWKDTDQSARKHDDWLGPQDDDEKGWWNQD